MIYLSNLSTTTLEGRKTVKLGGDFVSTATAAALFFDFDPAEVFYIEAWIVLCIFLCSSDKTSARQMAFVQGSELKNITYSIICQLPTKHTWNTGAENTL